MIISFEILTLNDIVWVIILENFILFVCCFTILWIYIRKLSNNLFKTIIILHPSNLSKQANSSSHCRMSPPNVHISLLFLNYRNAYFIHLTLTHDAQKKFSKFSLILVLKISQRPLETSHFVSSSRILRAWHFPLCDERQRACSIFIWRIQTPSGTEATDTTRCRIDQSDRRCTI